MRRFLLIAATLGTMTVAGAAAAKAAVPVQVVDWHHHPVVVDRCYRPEVRYYRPQVVYYPQVVAPPVYAAPVVAGPPVVATAPIVAAPNGFVSLSGRHFGIRFGF
jgi:hypothetical protein